MGGSAAAQLVNKLVDGEVAAFTQRDVLNFRGFAGYAATSLRNMRLFQIANHARAGPGLRWGRVGRWWGCLGPPGLVRP